MPDDELMGWLAYFEHNGGFNKSDLQTALICATNYGGGKTGVKGFLKYLDPSIEKIEGQQQTLGAWLKEVQKPPRTNIRRKPK